MWDGGGLVLLGRHYPVAKAVWGPMVSDDGPLCGHLGIFSLT